MHMETYLPSSIERSEATGSGIKGFAHQTKDFALEVVGSIDTLYHNHVENFY